MRTNAGKENALVHIFISYYYLIILFNNNNLTHPTHTVQDAHTCPMTDILKLHLLVGIYFSNLARLIKIRLSYG